MSHVTYVYMCASLTCEYVYICLFCKYVSFAEYCLFYRAPLQKRPMILGSLLIVATLYRFYVIHMNTWRDSLIRDVTHYCVTWPINMWRDLIICGLGAHLRDSVWQDSLIRDITHWHVTHSHEPWLMHVKSRRALARLCVTWLINMLEAWSGRL